PIPLERSQFTKYWHEFNHLLKIGRFPMTKAYEFGWENALKGYVTEEQILGSPIFDINTPSAARIISYELLEAIYNHFGKLIPNVISDEIQLLTLKTLFDASRPVATMMLGSDPILQTVGGMPYQIFFAICYGSYILKLVCSDFIEKSVHDKFKANPQSEI